jgi:2-hydroxychromene-2-carboxylate isomerase
MREILFHFDYLSPYSYLAWREVRARDLRVTPIPIAFGALLDHGGQLGPAEIPAKRRFMIRDCMRRAEELGVPFTFPPRHPFRTLDALRASIDQPPEVIDRLFAACWEHGRDLSDLNVLAEVLHPLPLPDDPALGERLRRNTDEAIARGVFGVPTFVVNGEVIWGSDRIADVLAVSEGRSRIDEAKFERFASVPAGVVRKAATRKE